MPASPVIYHQGQLSQMLFDFCPEGGEPSPKDNATQDRCKEALPHQAALIIAGTVALSVYTARHIFIRPLSGRPHAVHGTHVKRQSLQQRGIQVTSASHSLCSY